MIVTRYRIPLCLVLAMLLPGAAAHAEVTARLPFAELLRWQDGAEAVHEAALADGRDLARYARTVLEALQVANRSAILVNQQPLFCAPSQAFQFRDEAALRLFAAHLTTALFELVGGQEETLRHYREQPASEVLMRGLQAAYPCL